MRVGVCAAVSVAEPGGQSAAEARAANGVQRRTVCGQDGRAVVLSAQRSAAVVRGLSLPSSTLNEHTIANLRFEAFSGWKRASGCYLQGRSLTQANS
jgi:hypothetical protein